MSVSDMQKLLKENSTGKLLVKEELSSIIDKVSECLRQVLAQSSLVMFKHELNQFLDSLKSDGKEFVLNYVYLQLPQKPSIDLYYFRPKLEELFKEGVSGSVKTHLDLIENKAFFADLANWSSNTLHLILDKAYDSGREEILIKVLRQYSTRLSTIRLVDILKKIMIVDNQHLAQSFLEIVVKEKNHCKSNPR